MQFSPSSSPVQDSNLDLSFARVSAIRPTEYECIHFFAVAYFTQKFTVKSSFLRLSRFSFLFQMFQS